MSVINCEINGSSSTMATRARCGVCSALSLVAAGKSVMVCTASNPVVLGNGALNAPLGAPPKMQMYDWKNKLVVALQQDD
jgi:hypothetical protein